MPTYEYECSKCGHFEAQQRITDDPLQRCPKCRRKVRKLISRSSFQLKGSGWYITDYARKGSTAEAADGKPKSAESPDTAGASPSSADSAAAPAAKTDPGAAPQAKAEPKKSKPDRTKAA